MNHLDPQSHGQQGQWLILRLSIDNMRYTLDWCLFGFPNNGNQSSISSQTTQCQTSCTNMSKSLEINILTPNTTSTYDYCEDPNFLPNVDGCAKCLAKVPNQLYSANCKLSRRTAKFESLTSSSPQYARICLQNSASANFGFSH